LLLADIRDSISEDFARDYINSTYLKNEKAGVDTAYKIKLKQVESDWEAYKHIILNQPISGDDINSIVWKNYIYFKNRINSEIFKKPYAITNLIEYGLEKFSLVTIQLEPQKNFWENPQEIFESMNSLGKPLSLADLVRNYILLGKKADEQESLYHDYWLEMEKNLPGYLSDYIRDYMQLVARESFKKATERNHKELYVQFKQLFKKEDVNELLNNLRIYSRYYSQIVLGVTTGSLLVDRKINDLKSIDVTTLNSFLMAIISEWKNNSLKESEVLDIIDVFIIYFIRRKILRLTQGENKTFPRLIADIPLLVESNNKKQKMYEILSNQEFALRFPNDNETRQQLQVMNFYNFSHCKFILSLVEEKITKSRPNKNDKNLQVEHIMPQTLSNDWMIMLGEDYEKIHQENIHSIGNLTLIRHNQELGNKSFDEKKKIFLNNAGLQIAKTMIIENDTWNDYTINRRKEWIVNYILNNVFPLPSNMKEKNNFSKKDSSAFSLKEKGLLGKYLTYVNDDNIVVKVVNDKEVEFENIKWKLTPLVRELESRRGTVNSSGSYRGPAFWKYNGVVILDYNINEEED
ncbi:MAG: DUF262 domain-containing protein, partial [Erysipelotrichaceae bacterium]